MRITADVLLHHKKTRTEQNRTEQNRTEQNKTINVVFTG